MSSYWTVFRPLSILNFMFQFGDRTMANSIKVLFFALICQLSMVSLCSAETATAATTLRISTGPYSPWSDENSKHGGFVNRVIKEAFRREGIETEFLFWPWKRALESARSGAVDASSFWYVSEDKKADFYYSDPISEHKEVFFYLKDKNISNWKDLRDLKAMKIGASRGFTYTAEFWELGKQDVLQISEAKSDEVNFKKLLAGRIDLFPAAEVMGWQVLTALDMNAKQKVATLEKPLAIQDGHLLFPKVNEHSKDLLNAFNKALKSMREDGTLEQYRQDLMNGIY